MSALGEIALVRGLSYLSESQATIANNLANVSSLGFKRRIAVARPIGQSFNEMLEGRYPTTRFTEFVDWSLGAANPTGMSNHIAIQDKLFLKVQAGDGSSYYTRSGQLQLNSQSELVLKSGHKILNDEGQPIRIPSAQDGTGLTDMKISPSGVISDGKSGLLLARLAVFKVPDSTRLAPMGNGLFRYPENDQVTPVATNKIVQGALEQSNVEPTKELIDMILAQRGFTASMKALTTLGRIKETYVTSLSR